MNILISHHSTAIEGSSLTEDETRLLLTEGITAKGKPINDHNMVKDHHAALLETIKMASKKEKFTPEMIRKISALVMKTTGGEINSIAGTYNSALGDWRKSMVYVGTRYFSDYQKVPSQVKTLCDELNTKIDSVTTQIDVYNLSFDAHFGLVSIHPFADGNGRVSRLLMNYILAYHKLPLAVIFQEDKKEYFVALEESRKNDNIRFFYDFMYS
ncbi:MAG: Fic family protein, partial [Dysgonamonadaceae bacterium]|nr:Fic family protein [Dysgonamonadaceae bacterium]